MIRNELAANGQWGTHSLQIAYEKFQGADSILIHLVGNIKFAEYLRQYFLVFLLKGDVGHQDSYLRAKCW
jgi:hypothetical protein